MATARKTHKPSIRAYPGNKPEATYAGSTAHDRANQRCRVGLQITPENIKIGI